MALYDGHRLPDFLGVGPSRTGTSWLDQVLRLRADLPANVKEVRFFARYYYKGIDWYAWHFRHARGDRPIGELCPYFGSAEVRRRIKLHLPDCRIICTLRDPVDRLYSNYKLLRHAMRARAPFMEQFERQSVLGGPDSYAPHLADWFELYGRDRVKVLFYNELRSDPQRYIDRVCDFLEIERIDLAEVKPLGSKVNSYDRAPRNPRLARRARHWRTFLRNHDFYRTQNFLKDIGFWAFCGGRGQKFLPLTPEEDARVREWFLSDIEAVERLLGCDLSRWKTSRSRRDRPEQSGASARV